MIKIIEGNCGELLPQLIKQYTNKTVVLVSDPPYNVGRKYNLYSDKMDESSYYEWMSNIFKMAPSVIIHYPEALYRISNGMNIYPNKVVSWVYNSNVPKQHRDIAFFNVTPDFEKVRQPYKNPNDKRIKKLIASGKTGSKLYDWWEVNQVKNVSKEKTSHPCQIPARVMENIIGILPDDVLIIDPFCGSGSTAEACLKLNRDFIGIDIDPQYVAISKERLNNLKTQI
jgi:DNA modification methylase